MIFQFDHKFKKNILAKMKCPPKSIETYGTLLKEMEEAGTFEYIASHYNSNAYCPEGPQVEIAGVSKLPTEKITRVLDPVAEIEKLIKITEKKKKEECIFITRQFLAKMKEQGCTGVNCLVKGKACGSGSRVYGYKPSCSSC